MIHVIHTPTGWKVCQEHPEKPKYPICKDIIHESNYYPCRPDVTECYCRPYLQAVALSIANAVDVREEDQALVQKCFDDKTPYKETDLLKALVYELPELEMEIDDYVMFLGIWKSVGNNKFSNIKTKKLAHVFRKKEESDGQTNLVQYHDATGQITREEFDKMEESQEELWQMIQDEMIEDFRWPKDLLELLKSKFHLTRVKAELKGEKK